MIALSKLNGVPMVINAELIETIETTPDTVITMTTGRKIMVTETVEQIVKKTLEYKQKLGFFKQV